MIFTTLHPITSSLLKLEPSSLTSNNGDSLWQDNSNIIDTEKEWRISLDVPGVKSNDVDIKVQNGVLHIFGVRKFESSDGHVVKKLKFSKSFQLPTEDYGNTAIDPSQLQATLSDGVLVLQAPKKPRPQPVTISITVNNSHNKVIDNPTTSNEKDKPEKATTSPVEIKESTSSDNKAAKISVS
jgi:HSP20 family protein